MEKVKNDSWLAHVSVKNAIDGRAQIYIDGKLVHGVIGYKIEQDSVEKRVPVLTLQVQCKLDLESEMIPLLPDPWCWFYKPAVENLVGD